MKELAINLEAGEQILLRRKGVRRGGLGSYNNELILTNIYLICVTYNMFNQAKDSKIFLVNEIRDAYVGRGRNDELCLEVQFIGGKQVFYFEPTTLSFINPREYEIWAEALNEVAAMGMSAASMKEESLLEDSLVVIKNSVKESLGFKADPIVSEVKEESQVDSAHQQLEDLRKLQEMLNEGLITREEFNEMKLKILGLM